MTTSRSSVSEFAGTIRQCTVGLCRLTALLFVLQIALFAAIGATPNLTKTIPETGVSLSAHVGNAAVQYESGSGVSGFDFNRGILIVRRGVESISHLALLILVPLLGLLLVLSPMVSVLECKHLLLALITVVGLLPLVLCDLSSTPWAAGALPHLSNTLLIGGVVPLVATISMMSVAILLDRRATSKQNDSMISNPAASRTADRASCARMGRDGTWIKSSPRRRRMP
jgi:hypothetical protein